MLSIEERKAILENGNYETRYGFCFIDEENYKGWIKAYLYNNEVIMIEHFSMYGLEIKYESREWKYDIFDYCFWYEADQAEWKKHFGE